jgi:hypothetical protein
VEEQRFVGIDQELVERKATRRGVRHARREAIDAIRDLMCVRLHVCFLRTA